MRKAVRPLFIRNALKREQSLESIMRDVRFKGFEIRADAEERNVAMRKRLAKLGPIGQGRQLKRIAGCGPINFCSDVTKCPAACHHASRAERARIVTRMYMRLMDETDDIFLLTVVHDRWRKDEGHLHLCKPSSFLKWFDRRLDRLKHLKTGLRGVVGVDVSVNEVDGNVFWQPHIHAVLTGIDGATLAKTFNLHPTAVTRKPLMLKRVDPNSLANVIGYVLKRSVEKRVAYVDKRGRRNQRDVKVPADCRTEFDAWLLDQKITERFRVIGMRLSREPLVDPVSFRPNVNVLARRNNKLLRRLEDDED